MKLLINKETTTTIFEIKNKARSTMTGNAYKLWDYLSCFNDGWKINVRFDKLMYPLALSKNQVSKAWDELIEDGWIFRTIDAINDVEYIFNIGAKDKADYGVD